MTRSELIKRISERFPSLTNAEAEKLLDTVLDSITDALEDGGRVEIRGFGAFSIRTREARMARNPKTGENLKVEDRNYVYFRAGKALKDLLNA